MLASTPNRAPTRAVTRGGYLAAAVGFDGLRHDATVRYRLADRVIHNHGSTCRGQDLGTPGSDSAADILARVGSGDLDRVCQCFRTNLSDPAAPESLIRWAYEILTSDIGTHLEFHADRRHSLRYAASLPISLEPHVPFIEQVRAIAFLEIDALHSNPWYQLDVVAKALEMREAWEEALDEANRYGRWSPGTRPEWLTHHQGVRISELDPEEVRACYDELVNGAHMWHHVKHPDMSPVGYRYATTCALPDGIARTPLVFWPLVVARFGERFLCPDTGVSGKQVAWAMNQRPDAGATDVTDLVLALAAASTVGA